MLHLVIPETQVMTSQMWSSQLAFNVTNFKGVIKIKQAILRLMGKGFGVGGAAFILLTSVQSTLHYQCVEIHEHIFILDSYILLCTLKFTYKVAAFFVTVYLMCTPTCPFLFCMNFTVV